MTLFYLGPSHFRCPQTDYLFSYLQFLIFSIILVFLYFSLSHPSTQNPIHPSLPQCLFFYNQKKKLQIFPRNIEFLMKFCKQHLLIKLYYLVDVTSLFPVLYVAFCIEPAKYFRSQFACWAWWQKLCNIAVAFPRWNFSC